jgi:XTP/dITP diphosphohydrolase
MHRKFNHNKLLVASNNPGKIREIKELFSTYNIEIISITDSNIIEPEETGLTFADNAKLKAEYYGKLYNLPAIADDSGLSVELLDGFPGVYSARFAGDDKNFNQAFDLIEAKLLEKNLTTSPAFFTCSLALWWQDEHFEVFEGYLQGKLSFPAIGQHGFGYDPIFIANGYDKTLAQLDKQEKNRISHRAQAFDKLTKSCF